MKTTKRKIISCGIARLMVLVMSVVSMVAVSSASGSMVRMFDDNDMVYGNYRAFCKDNAGFLWIGTDAGLLCFDGNAKDIYGNDERIPGSISDSKVFSLLCDRNGGVWAGTANGLNYYDRNTDSFRLVKLPKLDLNGFVSCMMEYDDNNIAFIVGGIGLFLVDIRDCEKDGDLIAKRFSLEFEGNNFLGSMVNLGSQGFLVNTIPGKLYLVKPGGKCVLLADVGSNVVKMDVEENGDVILMTKFRVFRLNPHNREMKEVDLKSGGSVKLNDILVSSDVTYIATAGAGLWELPKGSDAALFSSHLYSPSIDLEKLKIESIFEDNAGCLWLGCNHKGVGMVARENNPFVSVSLNQVLNGNTGWEITGMAVTDHKIVAGLDSGRLLVMDEKGSFLKMIEIPGNSFISSVVADGKDGILVGVVRDGIWHLDLSDYVLSKVADIGRSYPGVILSVMPEGDILACVSEIGVMRYNRETGEKIWYYSKKGSNTLPGSYYSGVCRTKDGRIWIGCYSSLSCYDPEVNGFLTIDQGPFLKDVIHSVCDSSDGCIMVATGRGLLKYDPSKGVIVKKYTVTDGLADNDVRTLVRDESGRIWIGTLNGISCLFEKEDRLCSYRRVMGLSQKSYILSGMLGNRHGLTMGGCEGLIFFDPDSVTSSSFGSKIMLSGIFINGKRISPASRNDDEHPVITGNRYAPEQLRLSYKDKSLVLRLSTLDFRDASCVRYEWQLDGEGDNWHSTSPGEYFIYLPSLDPGKYTLRLRGWENDVCSEISEIKLDITPPWYLSDVAYFIYVMIAMVILGLLYKVIKNRREKEMNEAKIKYFIDISHEIRSPITLLLNPVDSLLKQKQSPETTSKLLTVRRNAQRVLNLADQLIDLRKIEKGKMRLVYKPTDVKKFVEELVEMFRPQAEAQGLKISFVCQEQSVISEVDRNNLDKILVNLISNAIKYTPSGGEVTVDLSVSRDLDGAESYVVKVTDTGIGLDNKLISHMFERFYRGREMHHSNSSGFGIGLDLCLRLVSLHGGEIFGKNREDGVKGSVFTVRLPLKPVKNFKDSNSTSEVSSLSGSQDDKEARISYISPLPSVSVESHKNGISPRIRVLVVDDDVELREYIKTSLGSAYKVVAVGNGEDALKEMAGKKPDVIVTDIRMDIMDGFELLRRVKSNLSTHHIPVILFSSSNDVDVRTKAWKNGADGYLAKPFSVEELEGMILGLISTRNKLKGKFSGRQDSGEKITTPKIVGRDEELMRKVNKYINDNLSEATLSVDGLSEYVGLSRSQFHRRLKEIIGMAPSDYIRNVKLQKASELLRQSDLDIAQIAYSLGFNAQSHFSTLFKRFSGLTPSEYRMREQGNSDNNF